MKNAKSVFFDNLAMKWEEMFYRDSRQPAALDALVRTYGIRPGWKVLDVGCGTGVVMERLSAAAGADGLVIGCDFSLPMLRCARDKRRNNCRFLCSDAQHAACKDAAFDCIVYFSCFPHFEDKYAALAEARRLLKPGACLIISHLLGSAEIACVHQRAGAVVAADVLPERAWFEDALERLDLRLESFIDRPGLYHLAARRSK